MRTQIILNPMADQGNAIGLKEKLLAWSNEYAPTELVTTTEPGHGRKLAASAVEAGFDCVVAAGGDGTIHEVINGLVHGGRPQTAFGVIPIGSGNDFAFGLGLLQNPKSAIRRIFTGKPRMVDLARLEDDKGRYVLVDNGVGIGFDATVAIQSRTITRVRGFAMYALATLRTIAFYYEAPRFTIQFDDELVEQDTLFVAIGVGPRSGGGFYLCPDANHNDNMLDSCTANPVSRLTMLALLPRVMRGSHVTSRHVTMRRSRTINIRSNRPMPIHVDGEIFSYPEDDVRRVTLTSLPLALSVMV